MECIREHLSFQNVIFHHHYSSSSPLFPHWAPAPEKRDRSSHPRHRSISWLLPRLPHSQARPNLIRPGYSPPPSLYGMHLSLWKSLCHCRSILKLNRFHGVWNTGGNRLLHKTTSAQSLSWGFWFHLWIKLTIWQRIDMALHKHEPTTQQKLWLNSVERLVVVIWTMFCCSVKWSEWATPRLVSVGSIVVWLDRPILPHYICFRVIIMIIIENAVAATMGSHFLLHSCFSWTCVHVFICISICMRICPDCVCLPWRVKNAGSRRKKPRRASL